LLFFFFKDTATTEIYTLSLHDALPICSLPIYETTKHALNERNQTDQRNEIEQTEQIDEIDEIYDINEINKRDENVKIQDATQRLMVPGKNGVIQLSQQRPHCRTPIPLFFSIFLYLY